MGKKTDTRDRMVISAALLLRENGVEGTSVPMVLEHASAPRGSVGHHFPGGKQQLVVDALNFAGAAASAAIAASIERGENTTETFSMMSAFYRRALIDTDFAAGCPVGAAAQTAMEDEAIRDAVAGIFDEWRTMLHKSIAASQGSEENAEDLADVAIAALEGALILAKADKSTEALDRVERQLTSLFSRSRE
jgi:AcrR family transcriptional regulator